MEVLHICLYSGLQLPFAVQAVYPKKSGLEGLTRVQALSDDTPTSPQVIKISISSVDLSGTTCVGVLSAEALLARLAVAVAGFNDASVVVDPHFQVLGS